MQIRRPLAGLFVALTLFGGGATLAGCGDPTSSDSGTPADTATNTTGGSNPSDESQGNVPENSNRCPRPTDPGSDVANGCRADQPARSETQRRSSRPVERTRSDS